MPASAIVAGPAAPVAPSVSAPTAPTAPAGRSADGRRTGRTIAVPRMADLVFIALAAVIPTLLFDGLMFTDGDMLRHVRLGEWMIQHRALLTVDHFSWTRAGAPFTAYEWLAEVLFGALHRAGGLAAVALGAAAVIAAAYALVFAWLVRRGVGHWTALAVVGYAVLLGAAHWLARPHVFTFLGCAVLLWLLESRVRRPFLAGVALFSLWVNLHPGAFVGFTILAVVAAGEVLEHLAGGKRLFGGDLPWLGKLLAGAALGLVLTPVGPGLLLHALRTLGEHTIIDNTREFLSPDFHTRWAQAFLAGVLGILALFALMRERPPFAALGVVLLFALGGATYRRNVPLFGLVAVPMLFAWPALHRAIPSIPRLARALRAGDRLAVPGVWSGAFALAMIALAAGHGAAGPLRLVPDDVNPARFPVEAVRWARAQHLTGRLFHDQYFGGYLTYAWPEQRVFIDGAADFYGPGLFREYVDIMRLRDGWQAALDRRGVQLVLVRAREPLALTLERYLGWQPLYRDDFAVLLRRPAGGAAPAAPGAPR